MLVQYLLAIRMMLQVIGQRHHPFLTLSAKTDNPALSNFNSNCENLFSSSKRPNININSFNSTSKLISSSTGS